jgi:hypothetical protein
MGPFTVDLHLIAALEHHAHTGIVDEVLLASVQSACPLASMKEIAPAALYIATDPAPASPAMATRLSSFSLKLRQMA